MADWERDSPPLQLGQQLQKAGELAHGVRLVPVGIGEVGIDALRLQAGQGAHRGNGVGRLRPVSLITQPAQTGHTGVRLHVDAQPPPCRLGGGGKGPGTLQIVDRLGQPIAQQLLRAVGWRVAQEQDRGEHPGLPQLPGLRQAGHRQVLRPQLLQLPGHGDRPVAIGVGLHHAQKSAPLGQQRPECAVVVLQIGQGDLRPGSSLLLLHAFASLIWDHPLHYTTGRAAAQAPSARRFHPFLMYCS